MECVQCPRRCSIDRGIRQGFCGVWDDFSVARIAPHMWEEPPISGTIGSGTVFFAGCNLRCVFCQNRDISRSAVGSTMTEEALTDAILGLAETGVHNINLVTPTHYTQKLAHVLQKIRPQLSIPIVWNSSAYESVESLKMLDGLVDIYLPDMKYFSSELSARYSSAPDYFPVAMEALAEMLRQVGMPVWNADHTLLLRGTVVRHLILPSHRSDSTELLRELHARFGKDAFLLSLMCQYTPEFAPDSPYKNLHRRLTTFEYDSVLSVANALGFDGFSQSLSSATADFTPRF